MADTATNVLRLKYTTASDKSKTINVTNVKDAPENEDVVALVQGILTNKVIFSDQPTTAVSAQLVTTTTEDYDIE